LVNSRFNPCTDLDQNKSTFYQSLVVLHFIYPFEGLKLEELLEYRLALPPWTIQQGKSHHILAIPTSLSVNTL